LSGSDAETRRALAAAAHARAGRALYAVAASELPAQAVDREPLARRWEREAALGAGVLLLELDDGAEPAMRARAAAFADAVRAPAVISAAEPPPPGRRAAVHVETRRPRPTEQRALWASALGPRASALNGSLDTLVAQFDLGSPAIDAISRGAGEEPGSVWDACRARARPRLGGLAKRIDAVAEWDDLVLPDGERAILREISAHVRSRAKVNDEWGFAAKCARGLGISALFEGPSGTGKTMAAEVLARALQLDLYRIDLSQVVSKYIGETERNLRVVFDAAESGAAILLFDEADALFGTRTEVKDSHDRYANIEVSYLLQRMESYRGLAILTTNAPDAIDTAFLRRLRFIVRFPFPGEAERTEIWERVFPERTPTAGLDHAALGRLNLAGGHIRNIALGAAFLAADEDGPVRMGHLARAARRECLKLGRPLAESEVASWH
ncbi:MAG: ATP-binding protein, partial [Actinomycetota bacterium]|nr:ATP-binding protein [Actinomycetota bacterium]